LDLARALHARLRELGIRPWLGRHDGSNTLQGAMPETDLALVLGGDGTFVSVARGLMGRNIPLAGINFGRVGFLSCVAPASWREFLEDLLAGRLHPEPRLALRWEHLRRGRRLASGWAVNEVLVSRRDTARLASLSLAVNKGPLLRLRADGILLATPTGSSGYARSAGGPLLFPSLQAYVAVAICPFLCLFPPLVLDGEAGCRVAIGAGSLMLTLDGQETRAVREEDIIEVRGEPGAYRVIAQNEDSYLSRLSKVGFILEEARTPLREGTREKQ
jgi:NAD+ kinase